MGDHRWLGLLRDHDFRQLFLADAVSQLGSQVSLLALPLAAVLSLHASNFEVGVLAACGTAAFLLVGLPSGAWVDRMRRRRVLIVGDLGRALALATVPAAWALGVLSMVQMYVVAVVSGVLTVFFDVAYQSYLPHLVGQGHIVEGNAKLEAVRGVGQFAGPSLAGVAVQVLTAPVAVAADAVSFAGSALCVRLIRRREEAPQPRLGGNLRKDIVEGLRFVFGNPALRAIAICIGSFNLLSAMTSTMLIVLLARDLGLSAAMIGVFFSIASVGGILGALTATKIASRIGQGPAIWVSIAVTVPCQLVIPAARSGWSLWAAAAAYLVIWFCVSVNNITQVSFRQVITPERLLGRMNATMRFVVWGTAPVGSVAAGIVGQLLGARPTLWLAAACGVIPVLPLLFSPLRTQRRLPAPTSPPLTGGGEGDAALAVDDNRSDTRVNLS